MAWFESANAFKCGACELENKGLSSLSTCQLEKAECQRLGFGISSLIKAIYMLF